MVYVESGWWWGQWRKRTRPQAEFGRGGTLLPLDIIYVLRYAGKTNKCHSAVKCKLESYEVSMEGRRSPELGSQYCSSRDGPVAGHMMRLVPTPLPDILILTGLIVYCSLFTAPRPAASSTLVTCIFVPAFSSTHLVIIILSWLCS